MSGLVLTLAPGESFIVNGAVLENGDRPSRIRIKDNDARVLRCSDAIKPADVDTPVKQVYFAIQLFITGDLNPDDAMPAVLQECAALEDVFSSVNSALMPKLIDMLNRGNFYSALNHLKGIMTLEQKLLDLTACKSELKVA